MLGSHRRCHDHDDTLSPALDYVNYAYSALSSLDLIFGEVIPILPKKTNCRCIGWRQEEFGIILIPNFQTMVPRHSLDISIKYSYVPQVRPSCFFSEIFPFLLSSLHDMMDSYCLHVFYVFSLFSDFVIDQ